jgi:D-alanyl-D-alanine carboxypeptidase
MEFVKWLLLCMILSAGLVNTGWARPSIVVDASNGTIIAGEDIDQRWHPASLTKLMTALVVFRLLERGDVTMNSPVKVSALALKQQPSKMSYPAGTTMRLGDALPMMIVKSANDISVAIAESTSGSIANFVVEMNREAFRLGLANTVFTNPTGLHDERQFTSARDLAIIATEIRRAFPQYADYYTHDAIKVAKATLPSFNLLLGRFEGADGMKTGFVCASGYNQVGSATREGRTIIAVVLGRDTQNSRAEDLAELLAQGFIAKSSSPFSPGVPSAEGPPNIRAKICPNGGPPSEDANLSEPNSPYLVRKPKEIINPLRITVGKPDGPIPTAAISFFGGKKPKADAAEKPVPVPTPRPDYLPNINTKTEIRGSLPARQP